MYRPSPFLEDDPLVIAELLRRAAFGHVVAVAVDGLVSTPMPFLVDADVDGRVVGLRGHLARANGCWRVAADAPVDALVVVPGVDTYVSPGWYPSKAEHGRVVPTWNYEVVHVHGTMSVTRDPAWLESLVRELTDVHEADRADPWSVDDAPRDFVERQLRAIVGVEVTVERIEAKRKLSQNRPEPDRQGVRAGLAAGGAPRDHAVAAAMDGDEV